jgi:hypothetical protein
MGLAGKARTSECCHHSTQDAPFGNTALISRKHDRRPRQLAHPATPSTALQHLPAGLSPPLRSQLRPLLPALPFSTQGARIYHDAFVGLGKENNVTHGVVEGRVSSSGSKHRPNEPRTRGGRHRANPGESRKTLYESTVGIDTAWGRGTQSVRSRHLPDFHPHTCNRRYVYTRSRAGVPTARPVKRQRGRAGASEVYVAPSVGADDHTLSIHSSTPRVCPRVI